MRRIEPGIWQPADDMQLEPSALEIAKGSENNLVVAGPGAGKTELLAQKACYLLQTNTCPFPYKILAISFKRDAAYNLKERVRLRCGDELSRRFDSLTFDSFAKQILDRFKQALLNEYKISSEYDVVLRDQTILDYYRLEDTDYINTTNRDIILTLHCTQLPHNNTSPGESIRNEVWTKMLSADPSKLSFKMIMRLAELIINTNPKIKQYLQQTYQYVFLDEFQDTTGIQYDLFKSCFLGSDSFYTAVGDDKQRIMLWAGAQNTIFEDFISDTGATRVPLTMNFRCAPRLVALLNHLTEHLLAKTDFATPSHKWHPDQGECSVWIFENPKDEMQTLFQDVHNWVTVDGLNPKDICILVKQQLSTYAGSLIDYFNQNGIKARDESKFQDMLTQEVCVFIINTMYAIFDLKNSAARQIAFGFLSNLHTELEDHQLLKLESVLSRFIKKIRKDYSASPLTKDGIKAVITEIIAFAGKDRIKASFSGYKNSAVLDLYIKEVENELINNYTTSKDIISALDMLIGKDTIPVMTIHKSKGLEYHTVIFIGLEDGAFWTFQQQEDEDKCAFFVALSRAKERVVFTFSKQREDKYGRMRNQSINNIEILFQELEKSGVVNIIERRP
ncbi:UvrD-helicase domain-containing protein [Parapedobacter indicus]|uniref:DNA 3'-5' helicase n=1 Tax=Parapedobacter indicus TaxID=1477437 RepID=A0A1I3ISX0_9SPHI|nr:ATP-dependent helicase [Parapedobacter indicus]PPL02280.1 superfamily I DNA/RNA helicase [Parapedobacter indicus]SFI51046.1 Superfamily I DNA or RNA helicase [Parapedobacter indicus]